MKIIFSLEYRAEWGQTLHITGPMETLGGGCDDRAPAMHCSEQNRWSVELIVPDQTETIDYGYIVKAGGKVIRREACSHRMTIPSAAPCRVFDRWADMPADNYLYSAAFTGCFFARHKRAKAVKASKGDIVLCAAAPSLRSNHVLAVTGSCEALGQWNTDKAVEMSDADFPVWKVALKASRLQMPFEYKFIIIDKKSGSVAAWERGENRRFDIPAPSKNECTVIAGLRLADPLPQKRAAGTAIPVFSLRSGNSFGTGEFYDLKLLVDWAAATGQSMIQILPINDTTMTGTWRDSYPYNANSTFALHPQFLHLPAVGKLPKKSSRDQYERLAAELNALPEIDYERVNNAKRRFLREIFAASGSKTLASEEFKAFFDANRKWLVPYAAFCALRDRFGTPEFSKWGEYAVYDAARIAAETSEGGQLYDEASFNFFLQYHLHLQMSHVHEYASSRGVALKGDIPIGISRTSADAWVDPDLFNMDCQAGAPPDDFSVLGQNWGFPTYNWAAMAADGYAWWKSRFRKMAEYFDAYRIDHILGFFRIWEIPCDAVHGLLGHFNPALPYSADQLRAMSFPFNRERHAEPYIYEHMLGEFFGEYAGDVRRDYVDIDEYGRCTLRSEVATQQAVAEHFAGLDDERSRRLRDGLTALADEVLFVEDPVQHGKYHPRISAQFTHSYRALSDHEKHVFNSLYDDFFYRRHNDFWYSEAMRKLPPLISATGMLVCGEDLGMIPSCVPAVMDAMKILSLEIQRMPKDPAVEFGDPARYPYLSVCTTSTHDMNPIRAWWEEDRNKTQSFYNNMLHAAGEAPQICTAEICSRIIDMHLKSPAMLTVLPLQDWLSADDGLRRQDQHAERINIPANSRHYWRYRMHLTLEQLLEAKEFNRQLLDNIRNSGR